MRSFQRSTWLVFKLRCSSALCLLVLPSAQQEEQRRLEDEHAPEILSYFHPKLMPPMAPRHHVPLFQVIIPITCLAKDGHSPASRIRQLDDRANAVSTWESLQSFLKGGSSFLNLFGANNKTQMEAVFEQPPKELLTSEEVLSPKRTPAFHGPLPIGPRWAIAHPDTDLSGTWKPIVTSEFQDEYNDYLHKCGTSFVFRQLCLRFCGAIRETIHQAEQGRVLHFCAKAPVGGWRRSLVSSGADGVRTEFEAVHAEFLDPDKELVQVEAWWAEEGRVHKSVLRNKPKVCGGEFETSRYLTRNDAGELVLVCESTFRPAKEHANDPSSKFKPAFVRWQYRREHH